MSKWKPIESAPKGGGAESISSPKWVNPPFLLLYFPNGRQAVCSYDWYYAEGGSGFEKGITAWVERISGTLVAHRYGNPTHWRPLPKPPPELD